MAAKLARVCTYCHGTRHGEPVGTLKDGFHWVHHNCLIGYLADHPEIVEMTFGSGGAVER